MSTVWSKLKTDLDCHSGTAKDFKYVIGRFADNKEYTLMKLLWTGNNFTFVYKDAVNNYNISNVSTAIWNSLDILVFIC